MQGLLMTAPIAAAISILFWIGVLGLAVGMGRRVALWRAGRAAPVNWLGLLAIPKRYFIDLHHLVARDPYIARTHIPTAGGAIPAMVLVGIKHGSALYLPGLDAATAIAAPAILFGDRN